MLEVLKPLSPQQVDLYKAEAPKCIGQNVTFYPEDDIELENYDLAIVGVREDRGALNNKGAKSPDAIRDELYRLINSFEHLRFIDLGNIEPGAKISDTYFALSSVVNELLKHKTIPIIIGGSHDLTYAQYIGYQGFGKSIDLVVVDERIDLNDVGEEVNDENHVYNILTHRPNFLKNFSQIGYQAHFTAPQAIHTLDKLNFDCYRLGFFKSQIEEAEPIVRDADALSFDISAIRQSDAPGKKHQTPNGFFLEDACQICKYSGLSDKLSSIGFYNFNPDCDNGNQTAQLVAQMIWYFVEGYYNRKNDVLTLTEKDFYKYIIHLKEEMHEMIFWKSKKSDRWWMEVFDKDVKGERKKPVLIPCSYADYQQACNGEVPERWLKAYHREIELA